MPGLFGNYTNHGPPEVHGEQVQSLFQTLSREEAEYQRTREAQRVVAHDASAFICKVKEIGGPQVARHDGQRAQQQQHAALQDAAAAIPAQQREDGAQVAACRDQNSSPS